jgi:tRNA G10  N-methylase Trm11
MRLPPDDLGVPFDEEQAFLLLHASLREILGLSEICDPTAVVERLKAIKWAFADDDTQYLAHDLHPYPAKFIPQIPANLIASLSIRGEVVWDPFGGSGTTALEALLLGRRAVSTDVNPLAVLITKAKCTALSPEQRESLRKLHDRLRLLIEGRDIEAVLDNAWPRVQKQVPEVPNLEHWFSPHVVRELAYVRQEIEALVDLDAKDFARVALSSIIVAVSNQDGETRYARRDKQSPVGRTIKSFCRALIDALRKHEPLEKLLGYRRVQALAADIRELNDDDGGLPPESVDLVVTSPPYANATDYHLYHRFRLFWMGFDPKDMARREIGSHLRHQRENRGFELYQEEMQAALSSINKRLRRGRYAVLVVGDSVFDGKTVRTAESVSRSAREVGFEIAGVISRPVHSTRRSFIAAARRTRSEDIVILRRPSVARTLHFLPPPYRMWPYEADLRRREIQSLLGKKPRQGSKSLLLELDPYQVDLAQRLAFTHEIRAANSESHWRTWQSVLENGQAVTGRKDPKYVTHGIHAYKGKFYPQLAKALVNIAGVTPGQVVLDPFCGSGTVLLESQLNGIQSVGCDLNPLAVLISRAKTAVATESPVALDRVLKSFYDDIVDDRSARQHLQEFSPAIVDDIESWFPPNVANRLGWLLGIIDQVPNKTGRLVVQTLLSSLIREVSNQEPSDLRIRRRRQPLKDAPLLELLREKVESFRRRLQQFGERMSSAPVAFPTAVVLEGDSRIPSTLREFSGRIACVVTSPPYATALPYIDTDRLSLMTVLGVPRERRNALEQGLTGSREIRDKERRELEEIIASNRLVETVGSPTAARIVKEVYTRNRSGNVGFRRRNMGALLLRYFSDMRAVLENLDRAVVPDGQLFFVIGDNKTTAGGTEVVIQSTKALTELGERIGWTLVATIPISVTKEALLNSHNSITENAVLWFRRGRDLEAARSERPRIR